MQDSTAQAAATHGPDIAKYALLGLLALVALYYIVAFARAIAAQRASGSSDGKPTALGLGLGFVTNFFDTLGIGSFAPTTSAFRFLRMVPDEKIPGTLNVGHTLPTIAQTFIFTTVVPVESKTLILMIVAAVLGSWLGAGVVSGLSRTKIQVGMGLALLTAALLLVSSLLGLTPAGGTALGVSGGLLVAGLVGNFILGALMTLGIGLYAPCLILVSMLGMNVTAAFPIMMGSCAFLMPVASTKFMRTGGFDAKAALGLALGGIPATLLAAFIVKSLPLNTLKWVVVVVILYTAFTLLRAASTSKRDLTA
ncbi:MAG: sulfite exporter TauE/SafE family protein [Gemmatimonadaceae bacterium]|nr:sulfite exporter TauE/SafE family protein [Gemmatimonadaceae bacterium]